MGRGEGTIEVKREGEKKTMQVGKTEKRGKKRRGKKRRMQGVCFEPLPC